MRGIAVFLLFARSCARLSILRFYNTINSSCVKQESKQCNTQACPVATPPPTDCVGAWSEWSACSCECGGGASTRKFTVSTPAANGGKACCAADGKTVRLRGAERAREERRGSSV